MYRPPGVADLIFDLSWVIILMFLCLMVLCLLVSLICSAFHTIGHLRYATLSYNAHGSYSVAMVKSCHVTDDVSASGARRRIELKRAIDRAAEASSSAWRQLNGSCQQKTSLLKQKVLIATWPKIAFFQFCHWANYLHHWTSWWGVWLHSDLPSRTAMPWDEALEYGIRGTRLMQGVYWAPANIWRQGMLSLPQHLNLV